MDANGCKVPHCTPLGCPDVPMIACGPEEHVEWVDTGCGCSQPQCVADGGCGVAVPGANAQDAGAAIAYPDCGCPAVEPPSCAPGQMATVTYDASGCPIPTCESATCPSDNEIGYASHDANQCKVLPFSCKPGEEYYYDANCGCGCRTVQANECVIGGCSGELCVEAGTDAISTCERRAEYACYQKLGVCGRQADGQCGWTQTADLVQCVDANIKPL